MWSIHSFFHWCKNYKHRPRTARVIVENKVALFRDTVYNNVIIVTETSLADLVLIIRYWPSDPLSASFLAPQIWLWLTIVFAYKLYLLTYLLTYLYWTDELILLAIHTVQKLQTGKVCYVWQPDWEGVFKLLEAEFVVLEMLLNLILLIVM